MQKAETEGTASQVPNIDDELADVLIAISVIAKRLAKKLQNQSKENGGHDNE